MDYRQLVNSPVWKELEADSNVQDKIASIRRHLCTADARDPYVLGRLQGQLQIFQFFFEHLPTRFAGGSSPEDGRVVYVTSPSPPREQPTSPSP